MTTLNLDALIALLDDPDPEIVSPVRKRIIEIGLPAIEPLELAWEKIFDDLLRLRIEELIETIHFNALKEELTEWVKLGSRDLLYGAYLMARFQFPDLNYEEINKAIEEVRKDAWLELAPNLTALERVKILNHILFDVHKFSGNLRNYYAPRNSYINQVLESKKGNPISLAIIYSEIAQRLDIPIYGVNLPKNYILAYVESIESIQQAFLHENQKVILYINPFNRGAVFSKGEIDQYLKQQRLEPNPSYYYPCSNIDTVYRIAHNLSFAYKQLGDLERINKLNELKNILKPEWSEENFEDEV